MEEKTVYKVGRIFDFKNLSLRFAEGRNEILKHGGKGKWCRFLEHCQVENVVLPHSLKNISRVSQRVHVA